MNKSKKNVSEWRKVEVMSIFAFFLVLLLDSPTIPFILVTLVWCYAVWQQRR